VETASTQVASYTLSNVVTSNGGGMMGEFGGPGAAVVRHGRKNTNRLPLTQSGHIPMLECDRFFNFLHSHNHCQFSIISLILLTK
jgi:hypothetical protein